MDNPNPQVEMTLKTADFYKKESDRLLKQIKKETSIKGKIKYVQQLMSLKSKISFEIKQIDKLIRDSEDEF
jgi:hypothetical protein